MRGRIWKKQKRNINFTEAGKEDGSKEAIRAVVAATAAAESLQSCPTLRDPIDGSPPGSPIPGTLQARTLEWVAISFSSAWKWKVKVKLLSRIRLSDPMDCSPPGSSIHVIFQARGLEWGAIAFSESSWLTGKQFALGEWKGLSKFFQFAEED